MKILVVIITLTSLFLKCQSNSLAGILGLQDLLNGLAVSAPSSDPFNNPSTAYMLDPNINVFLTLFRTRTQFCEYKCKTIFNLPCFLLFACNIHLRNFLLIFMLPFFMLVLTGICCGKGLWSWACWIQYVRVFLGINFVIWVVNRCREGGQIRRRKLAQKQAYLKRCQTEKNEKNLEIEPVSNERFTNTIKAEN